MRQPSCYFYNAVKKRGTLKKMPQTIVIKRFYR